MTKGLLLVGLAAASACYSGSRSGAETPAPTPAETAEAAAAQARAREQALAVERHEAAIERLERKLEDVTAQLEQVNTKLAQRPPTVRPPRPEPDRALVYAVPIDGNPFDGPATAKITLVKAFDYACGFCEKNRSTIEDLKKKYGKDLRVVYKHMVIHPKNAMVGALAFCAAAKQGKHREMDQLIWDRGYNQRQLDLTELPLDPTGTANDPPKVKCWEHPDGCQNVDGYAADLRLNAKQFRADLKGDCTARVADDGRELGQLAVSATPSFFINGRYLSGAQPIEQFSALIDEELAKARERIAAGTPAAKYYQKWVIEKGLKAVTAPPAPTP